jgi:hypothetical protein
VPVGRANLQVRRFGREPGGAEVGAGARLHVGFEYVFRRGCAWVPGDAAVGAGARLPVVQAGVRERFPEPPRDSGMGAGAATVGRMSHITDTQTNDAATSDAMHALCGSLYRYS